MDGDRLWLAAGGLCAAAPGGGLAGELAGDGQRGLPATNRDREDTKMKRRLRRTHLGSQNGGRGTGEGDRGGAADCGGELRAAALRPRKRRGGVVRGDAGVVLSLYRVEEEGEEACKAVAASALRRPLMAAAGAWCAAVSGRGRGRDGGVGGGALKEEGEEARGGRGGGAGVREAGGRWRKKGGGAGGRGRT
jgi:hypothetical protein